MIILKITRFALVFRLVINIINRVFNNFVEKLIIQSVYFLTFSFLFKLPY